MNPDYQKRSWQIIKKIYNLWFSSNIINFEYYRIKKKKIKKKTWYTLHTHLPNNSKDVQMGETRSGKGSNRIYAWG